MKMHRYSYITKYLTIEEIRNGIIESLKLYEPFADKVGKTAAERRRRMKALALIDLQVIAVQSETVEDFVRLTNERLGDFDEDNNSTVEWYIYKWVTMNVFLGL